MMDNEKPQESNKKRKEILNNEKPQKSNKKRKQMKNKGKPEENSNKGKEMHNNGKPQDNNKKGEEIENNGKPQEISKKGKEMQNDGKPRENSTKRKEMENNGTPQESREEGKEVEVHNNEKPQGSNKKRKCNLKALFGNYRHYYGYRLPGKMNQDPRFKVFKKEWFQGKDCLDIGCNEGLITIEIAKRFCCQSILGIDIDKSLIKTASWNLKGIPEESASGHLSNASETALSDSETKDLLGRVSFQKENFVTKFQVEAEKYDTILCLSVTKWIHLNWGDDGLITLFTNIWKQLRPGGILVLEPQPWKSYQKNYQVSEIAMENYNSMSIYPQDFQEILLDKIGFRTVENISESVPGSTAGFNRPILLFRK